MGKLKIKQKKKAFVPYANNQAHMFAQSIQNCQKELKEMEKKVYEDGFTVGEDWSNTIHCYNHDGSETFIWLFYEAIA